jgi:uncharacterized protein (TIGR03435 family)
MRTDSSKLLAVGIFGGGSRLRERVEILLRRGRSFSPRASGRRVALSALGLTGLMLAGSLAPRWIAFGQGRPSFEAASVKPAGPDGERTGVFFLTGGRFETLGATLRMILTTAYDVRDYQIAGAPGWADAAKFDIEAKAANESAGTEERRLMAQSLLDERFHLAVRRETREGQVYELTLAKGGSKLREATDSLQSKVQGLGGGRGGLVYGMACPVRLLVNQLSQELGRPVIDKTGLAGVYDFRLKWTPELGGLSPGKELSQAAADDPAPSLFTAVEEDLGLHLQAAKGPVETLVIDHVEKPNAN